MPSFDPARLATRFLVAAAVLVLATTASAGDEHLACTTTRFDSGAVSTERCVDVRGNGRARAFRRNGDTLDEWQLSRAGMYSSVRFTFHPNGAVRTAHYSAHPDGGIQWYRRFTRYASDGTVVEQWAEDWDRDALLRAPVAPPGG